MGNATGAGRSSTRYLMGSPDCRAHRMLHVYSTTRNPLRPRTWRTQGSWLPDSVLCGTAMWLAIVFVPKWTSVDALAAVGDVSADYAEEPLYDSDELALLPQ